MEWEPKEREAGFDRRNEGRRFGKAAAGWVLKCGSGFGGWQTAVRTSLVICSLRKKRSQSKGGALLWASVAGPGVWEEIGQG